MSVWKRAGLYLMRKKGRTILLFIYMFGMACSVFTAVFLKEGSEKELNHLQNTFGAGFVLSQDMENEAFFTMADFNGQTSEVYQGPIITDETIAEVLKIPGIIDYTLSNHENLVYTDLKLHPGAWADTEENEIFTEEMLKIDRQKILAYLCRNGDRHANFSTGALTISEGRNLMEGDRFKAVISEELAQRNQLSVGGSFSIEEKEGLFQPGSTPSKTWGKPIELQIVGIFHMNFLQPVSEYTHEDGFLENNIYVDLETNAVLKKYFDENWYTHLPEEGYQEVTFFVEEPGQLDSIMKEVRNCKNIETEGLRLEADSNTYQSSAKSYEMVRSFASALFIINTVGAAAILFLFMRLWIRGRKRETGILLSVGTKKGEIIWQMMTENLVISVAALFLSLLLSGTLAHISSQAAEQMTLPDAEAEKYHITMEYGSYPRINLSAAEEAAISDEVTPRMVLIVVILVSGISAVSVLLASVQILEIEPKKILQSM